MPSLTHQELEHKVGLACIALHHAVRVLRHEGLPKTAEAIDDVRRELTEGLSPEVASVVAMQIAASGPQLFER